jgi:hypothetical protein
MKPTRHIIPDRGTPIDLTDGGPGPDSRAERAHALVIRLGFVTLLGGWEPG